MEINNINALKEELFDIILQAGDLVADIYMNDDFDVRVKEDATQVTQADEASEAYICQRLKSITPDITIIAEEAMAKNLTISPKNMSNFWLVDPVDGTKGFISKNGEFSINIALVINNKPVLGLIHNPLKQITYWGNIKDDMNEAYYIDYKNNQQGNLKFRLPDTQKLAIFDSRFHQNVNDIFNLPDRYNIEKRIILGSALKFCELAKGNADIHIRYGNTMEWDTAAGQVILEACGGKIVTFDQKIMTYHKPNFLNSSFIACHKDFLLV